MADFKRPPLKITLKTEEGEETIHMSYGLWSDLQRVCPDAGTALESGFSDPWARDYIIRRCFTPSKKIITDEAELTPAEKIEVADPDEIEKLLNWVMGHLLHFFASSAAGLKVLGEKFKNQSGMTETPAAPSSDGSEA